jgi:hypothetical protein
VCVLLCVCVFYCVCAYWILLEFNGVWYAYIRFWCFLMELIGFELVLWLIGWW